MRIASYNLCNLLDAAQAETAGVGVKSEDGMKALAGTIGQVNADVLLVQEVGSRQVLGLLNERLAGAYPFLEVLPGNSPRGIHLGILSREPFQLTSHRMLALCDAAGQPLQEYDTEADAAAGRAAPVRLQRDLLLAEVMLEDAGVLALFNVHLKSRTNRPWRMLAADDIRVAEVHCVARVVREYLDSHSGRPVIVAGDFNDTRHSDVLATLFRLPLADPMGEVLAKTGRNPSTYWPKRRMRLDYLLLSETARSLLLPGSPAIHAGQRARRASDHYPVSVDLDPGRLPAGD